MNILSTTGGKIAATVIAGAALYGAKALVTKNFDIDEFGDALFRGGAKKK